MKLFIIIALFVVQYASAGIVGDTRITGRVLKYNKKTVTLSQYGKRKVTVPINSLKKDFKKLKTGILVTAVFSTEEIMKKIKEQSKK